MDPSKRLGNVPENLTRVHRWGELTHHLGVKKFPGFFRRNMVPLIPQGDPYAGLIALFHTEAGLKADLFVKVLFLDHLLKSLDHIVGPFDMAGTSDANA
jgi:hypothetical protein